MIIYKITAYVFWDIKSCFGISNPVMVAMAYLILRWLSCVFQRCGGRFEIYKKSLKIPKGQSESVYRRTENTMAKKKKYKWTNNDLQNIHIKLKIE